MSIIRKAIFPLGGRGSRLFPWTSSMPKEMLPIINLPLIHYAVKEAVDAGIEELIFVIAPEKTSIRQYFEFFTKCSSKHSSNNVFNLHPDQISFVTQQSPKGLGHAIWCARKLITNEPFAVILPDDFIQGKIPCIKQMSNKYSGQGAMIAAMEVPSAETQKYGIFNVTNRESNIVYANGLVEKPAPGKAPSNLAAIGRYILPPKVMDTLETLKPGHNGEIQLTDALCELEDLCGFLFDGHRFDCGTEKGFVKSFIFKALERNDLRSCIDEVLIYHKLHNML